MRRSLARASIGAGLTLALLAPFAATALAVVVTPPGPRGGSLAQVGPIAEHGFPSWYRDTRGVRLEACTTLDDPLCSTLPDEVPDPDSPVSYPDNFPGEFFYQLAGATVTLSNGVRATVGMDLEGAWAREEVIDGDQMVFGRIRIRFDAPAGERYRITHPYGVDDLVATDRGVNMTDDVGTTPGAFGGALASRIGPFLVWDPAVAPAAPAGYTGDPGIDHAVVGSPYGTDFVRIERLDPATGTVLGQVGFTDQFSIQGRYATNAGVDVDRATYTAGPDGTGTIDVYATSEPGQAIEVTGNAALGFRTTRLHGQDGHYYGRLPLTGAAPATVEIVNASDRPVTRKTAKLVDVVHIGRAAYDAAAHTLTVTATSSDADPSPGVLSVTGYGPLTGHPFTGVLAPPPAVTVTSSGGGSAVAPLIVTGEPFRPAAPVAAVAATGAVIVGQTVQLDGTGSTGEIDGYAWTQTAGSPVTLTGTGAPTARFVAPAPGTYTFQLVVTGPGGTGAPASVTVPVIAATGPDADAGVDQTVQWGRVVALDGSRSTAAGAYAWRQVSGPVVTLTGATAAKPSFTYPLQAMPAAPGPNPGYLPADAPVVLELTVTNPAGTDTDQVIVRAQPETLSGVTARYRTRGEWRIDGTSDVPAGQRVAVVLGSTLTGTVVGTTTVDATGAISLRAATPPPGTVRTVSIVTALGGRLLAVPVTVTN